MKACCPTCNTVLWQLSELDEPDGVLEDESDNESRPKRRKRNKTEADREVGDDYNLVQPKMKDSSKWIKQYDTSYPRKELGASAKTIAVKNQILLWQREAPEDKIIGRYSNHRPLLSSLLFLGFQLTPSQSLCQLGEARLHHRQDAQRRADSFPVLLRRPHTGTEKRRDYQISRQSERQSPGK